MRIALAVLLTLAASACVDFRDVWRQRAEKQCNESTRGDSSRLDCYQRAERGR
jgi:hypothetical protein